MPKPNIVFILLDDFGWRDSGCYGSAFYETPNIDRLSAGGMRFTDAYAACPVCSPTRASLLSGRYPARLHLTNYIAAKDSEHPARGRLIDAPYVRNLPEGIKTLPAALRGSGYATWHVGKWHLGEREHYPERHGFDINVGGCEWGAPYKGYFSPWHIPVLTGEDAPEGTLLTDALTDRAIELIETRDQARPFFLNLWYYAVHTPIQATPERVCKYEAKARSMGLDRVDAIIEGEFFPSEGKRTKRVQRRIIQSHAVYAAMIEAVDANIGRLLDALEGCGLTKDTLVLFSSDNGGLATAEGSPTCNAPLSEGKGWMYEGGTREPLIVRYPGYIPEGSICAEPVTSPDIFPTLLDMADLPPLPEAHCDGVSIRPLLEGSTTWRRGPIFWHYPHYGNQGGTPGASMRDGDWKLVRHFEDDRVELYNLRDDIGEARDLARRAPERTRAMVAQLEAWQQSVTADFPTPNPDYRPPEVDGFAGTSPVVSSLSGGKSSKRLHSVGLSSRH